MWGSAALEIKEGGGLLQNRPQRCGHLQDSIGRAGLTHPGTDGLVLLRGQKVQRQHLIERLHGGLLRGQGFWMNPNGHTLPQFVNVCHRI